MKALALSIALSAFAAPLFAQQGSSLAAQAPPATRTLGSVRSIYVAQLGDADLRQFILQRLLKWKEVKVLGAEEADAILTGASESHERAIGTSTSIFDRTNFTGEVTLVDPNTQVPIWATEKGKGNVGGLLTGGLFGGGATSRAKLADQIVNQLQKDWKAAQPKK